MNALTPPPGPSSRKYKHLGISSNGDGSTNRNENTVDFSAIGSTVWSNKWLILLTGLLVTGAVTAYTLTLPKVYESTAIVSVGANSPAPSMEVWPVEVELDREIGRLENSGELNQRILKRLTAVADTAAEGTFTIFRPVDGAPPEPDDVIERLRDRTSFEGLQAQSMVQINAVSESPEEATHIVNAYAEEYNDFSREMARAGVSAARSFLEIQTERRREELAAAEAEWQAFALENNVATDGEGGQRAVSQYVELESKQRELEFQLEQEQRMKSVLESQLEQVRPALRSSVLAEQEAQSLRTQIQALEDERARLNLQAGQYYANNPNLRGNEERVPELAELNRRIESNRQRTEALTEQLVVVSERGAAGTGENAIGEISALQERIQERALNIQELEEQIQGLDAEIAGFQGEISDIPRQTIQREQIQRRLDQAETFYRDVAAKLQETIIAEESELGYVDVVRAGTVPTVPVSPDLNQNILLGVLLGLGFGVGLAFVVQSTNRRLNDPEDLQTNGYNLLGVVPPMDRFIKEEFDGRKTVDVKGQDISTTLFPLLNPWSTVTENYRLMRANLLYPGAEGDELHPGAEGDDQAAPQVLLVTSPGPGDGKTTMATNLALTFALSGRKVLLIDADLRQPNVHNLLDLERSPGLADVLRGKRSLQDVKRRFIEEFSFLDGLSVVPAGETQIPPTEMLDSSLMRQMIAEGREQADIVIIDTPPVLSASDATILAVQADATLVVASAGQTDRDALNQVRKTLKAVGVPISAVIFNRFNVGGGYYEYGYGGDYYGPHPKLEAAAA